MSMLEHSNDWSQNMQYTFAQYVRRRTEGFIEKVTCLPSCKTKTAVRPEIVGAVRKCTEPVTGSLVLSHQVQHLVCQLYWRTLIYEHFH